MPHVARNGDRGPKGFIQTRPRSHRNLSDTQPTAIVGDPYECEKKGHSGATLKNGCFFFKIDGQPVAMQYATVATCGCRILQGSPVHRCCPHLDAKARRLAEREMKIEAARDLLADAERRPGESVADWRKRTGLPANQMRHDALAGAADELERLNRDVRRAEASLAVYGAKADDPRTFGGNAGLDGAPAHNAPEAMLNLRREEFRDLGLLPEEMLNDDELWINNDTNYYAAPYYDELTGEVTIAFRGTELDGSLNDPESKTYKDNVLTNVPQGVGEQTAQYDAAMTLGESIQESGDKYAERVTFAGHSKGGGQAGAAGIIGNRPFVSFNPATLSPMTPYRFSEGERTIEHGGPLGTRYRTHFDYVSGPLDAASRNFRLGLLDRLHQWVQGEPVRRVARPVGDTVFELPPRSANTHSMGGLIDAIEARKAAALAVIDRELGAGRPGSRLPPLGGGR